MWSPEMLEARSLTKYYGHTAAVRHVSFTVKPGEILGYLGPNGAGKSTTVQMLLRGRSGDGDFTAFQGRLGLGPEKAPPFPACLRPGVPATRGPAARHA